MDRYTNQVQFIEKNKEELEEEISKVQTQIDFMQKEKKRNQIWLNTKYKN